MGEWQTERWTLAARVIEKKGESWLQSRWGCEIGLEEPDILKMADWGSKVDNKAN